MGPGISKDGAAAAEGVKLGEKIGSGGFSEVYRGTLRDGRQ